MGGWVCVSRIALVAAQRRNRCHLQRAASREVAGHQCHSRQREDDQCERQRIRDRDAPEKAAYDGHHHERRDQSDPEACGNHRQPVPEHQAQHVQRLRTKRATDGDLVCDLAGRRSLI